MGDLVPVPMTTIVRTTPKEIRVLRRQAGLALANEDAEALLREARIRNGVELAHHAARRLAILNQSVTELTHDNPGLEVTLRLLEHSVAIEVGGLIGEYIRR